MSGRLTGTERSCVYPRRGPAHALLVSVRGVFVSVSGAVHTPFTPPQSRPPSLPRAGRATRTKSIALKGMIGSGAGRGSSQHTERFHDRPIGSVKRQLASNVAHGRRAVEAKAAALDLARLRLTLQC